jgi:hypothetical protein
MKTINKIKQLYEVPSFVVFLICVMVCGCLVDALYDT